MRKPYYDFLIDGKPVYKFATRQVPDCINEALQKADMSVEDIDLFVLHQANARIIEAAAKRLRADLGKFPMNVDRMGNMSSATIPVLLDELNREGKINRGDKLVFCRYRWERCPAGLRRPGPKCRSPGYHP